MKIRVFWYVKPCNVFRTGKGKGNVKGKAILLQALTGPEGPRKLRFPDFKTIGT
jgi:hypothetical protein